MSVLQIGPENSSNFLNVAQLEVEEVGFRLHLAPEPICHIPVTFQDQLASWAGPHKAHSTARLSFGEGWC